MIIEEYLTREGQEILNIIEISDNKGRDVKIYEYKDECRVLKDFGNEKQIIVYKDIQDVFNALGKGYR